MAPTAGYQAGVSANDVQLSYGVESTWGTAPSTTFQAIRLTSENLTSQKTRTRPQEINNSGEVSASVTTQQAAAGPINFGLSYGTYDDMLSVVMRNDWQAPQAIAGVSGDITMTVVSGLTGTLSSTTAGKFTNVSAGQWIRGLGFTNAANNNYFYVTAKADAQHLSVTAVLGAGPLVTETPTGTAAQIRASTLRNGVQFKSLYFQKKMSSSLWFQYPGSFIDSMTLSGAIGQFLSGNFTAMAQSELKATSDISTGGVLAAPGGTVNNPVGQFRGVFLNEASLPATCDQFSVQAQNTGAGQDFGLGTPGAAGIRMGQMQVTGSLRTYFKDFTLYTKFVSETLSRLAFISEDAAGNAYVLTVLNAALMNPKIVAGGVNQPVYATFDIEGNPLSGGGTIQLDRLPAT